MANPFVHVELQTGDVAKAKDFYRRLFDWKLEDTKVSDSNMPQGFEYTIIKVGEGVGGGMMKAMGLGKAAPMWLPYVLVDDVEASTRKAKELGAEILLDTTKVGDFGVMSVFKDPTGATLALWKVLKPPTK
jgi:uncharacterized protein